MDVLKGKELFDNDLVDPNYEAIKPAIKGAV
jgi:hypothetical protein